MSAKLTIFEGCDGSGKSTIARAFAHATSARYVHLGPFPRVTKNLARLYVDAMLPALLGYHDVVMDRCWLSEPIYGAALREGLDRIGTIHRRMLERLALRCQAVVVRCDPGWGPIEQSYRLRHVTELPGSLDHLRDIYSSYRRSLETELPCVTYDYNAGATAQQKLHADLHDRRHAAHDLAYTAGSGSAAVLLVGEGFGPVKNGDSLYQWPFVSFNNAGCSAWLTQQLDDHGLAEAWLMWANADQPLAALKHRNLNVVALGTAASTACREAGLSFQAVDHPQFWMRFNSKREYPLISVIKEFL